MCVCFLDARTNTLCFCSEGLGSLSLNHSVRSSCRVDKNKVQPAMWLWTSLTPRCAQSFSALQQPRGTHRPTPIPHECPLGGVRSFVRCGRSTRPLRALGPRHIQRQSTPQSTSCLVFFHEVAFQRGFVWWRFVLLGHLLAVGDEMCVFRNFATLALSFCDVTFHLGRFVAENATFRIQGLGWPRHD